jgi:hypothetical protein
MLFRLPRHWRRTTGCQHGIACSPGSNEDATTESQQERQEEVAGVEALLRLYRYRRLGIQAERFLDEGSEEFRILLSR